MSGMSLPASGFVIGGIGASSAGGPISRVDLGVLGRSGGGVLKRCGSRAAFPRDGGSGGTTLVSSGEESGPVGSLVGDLDCVSESRTW